MQLPRTERWQAPEYDCGGIKLSDAKLMDIFSFGMVCFWLLFPKDFDDLNDTRGAPERINGWVSFETKAKELASKADSLDPSHRRSLAEFFSSTLCEDPQERKRDWPGLVGLLGQELYAPRPSSFSPPRHSYPYMIPGTDGQIYFNYHLDGSRMRESIWSMAHAASHWWTTVLRRMISTTRKSLTL